MVYAHYTTAKGRCSARREAEAGGGGEGEAEADEEREAGGGREGEAGADEGGEAGGDRGEAEREAANSQVRLNNDGLC